MQGYEFWFFACVIATSISQAGYLVVYNSQECGLKSMFKVQFLLLIQTHTMPWAVAVSQ